MKSALVSLIDDVGLRLGLTLAGLRAAQLCLVPLPERRRRVLDDLRRMQGRHDLADHERKRKVRAIITQNIGATLGLDLKTNGTLRVVAERADYNLVGGLINDFGAETVWLTACAIAGQAIEGKPLDYLRATLSHQRERLPKANGQRPTLAGLGDHAALDYASAQVLPQEA